MGFRVGMGYDIHRLAAGRKLFLGGIEIPFDRGLLGHSDGDVLLHAICDAILGACGMPDIGENFPDTDPALKGISSSELLKKTCAIVKSRGGCRIVNIDAIVVCDEPKLTKYKQDIRRHLAEMLEISADSISMKAKTTESTATDVIVSYATALVELKD